MTVRYSFRDLLKRVERPLMVVDGEEYDCVGVRWWGRGAFIRETKPGEQIAKKKQYTIRSGDIVYNKLFAWRGAFAIADETVDGCIVSDKFPTYRLVSGIIVPEYLGVLFQSPGLAARSADKSTGMASVSKFTLNPPRFWELSIPVPSIDEQLEIVRRVQQIDEYNRVVVAAVRSLTENCERLVATETCALTEQYPRVRLGSLGRLVRRSIIVRDDVVYKQVTIGMNNKGVRLRGLQAGFNIGVRNQARVIPGDLIFSRIDIRNGAIGFVPEDLADAIVANDFPVFELGPAVCRPYLDWYIRTPDFRRQSIAMSAGATNRRKMTRDSFLGLQIPLPDPENQMTIAQRLEGIHAQTRLVQSACADILADTEKARLALIEKVFRGEGW